MVKEEVNRIEQNFKQNLFHIIIKKSGLHMELCLPTTEMFFVSSKHRRHQTKTCQLGMMLHVWLLCHNFKFSTIQPFPQHQFKMFKINLTSLGSFSPNQA